MYTFGLLCNLAIFFDLAASASGAEAEAKATAAALAPGGHAHLGGATAHGAGGGHNANGAGPMDAGGGGAAGHCTAGGGSGGAWRDAIEFLLELEAPLPGRPGTQVLVPGATVHATADADTLARSVGCPAATRREKQQRRQPQQQQQQQQQPPPSQPHPLLTPLFPLPLPCPAPRPLPPQAAAFSATHHTVKDNLSHVLLAYVSCLRW